MTNIINWPPAKHKILQFKGTSRQVGRALKFLCQKAGNRTLGELAPKEKRQ